jgi:hypothetical protein
MLRKGLGEEKILYHCDRWKRARRSATCREMGVSPQAFYSWKRRYAGRG